MWGGRISSFVHCQNIFIQIVKHFTSTLIQYWTAPIKFGAFSKLSSAIIVNKRLVNSKEIGSFSFPQIQRDQIGLFLKGFDKNIS